jgi:hypothetical protein
MRTNSKASHQSVLLYMLNIFFHLVHLAIVFFFLFGWLSSKTLLAHFILSILILLSWSGLGIFYGFGYCLVTDIQWKIKKRMGQEPYTEYYIKYMLDKLTGLDLNSHTVNAITTAAFFIILLFSTVLILNRQFSFF